MVDRRCVLSLTIQSWEKKSQVHFHLLFEHVSLNHRSDMPFEVRLGLQCPQTRGFTLMGPVSAAAWPEKWGLTLPPLEAAEMPMVVLNIKFWLNSRALKVTVRSNLILLPWSSVLGGSPEPSMVETLSHSHTWQCSGEHTA